MKKLTFREILAVASMLFGMFFGAGNLIFPASMGQMAGRSVFLASLGLLVTGVGLPLLGVAALGISREDSLLGLSSRVGKRYGLLFTCALYLTIGPLFAIPRCATVSYSVGIQRVLPGAGQTAGLAVFSLLFFGLVLVLSLRPGEILTWVGKVLNPLFLAFLALLLLRALTAPGCDLFTVEPVEDEYYVTVDYPMEKGHFLSFLAGVSDEGVQLVKLYPEGSGAARLKLRRMKWVYAYCNRHGLFRCSLP